MCLFSTQHAATGEKNASGPPIEPAGVPFSFANPRATFSSQAKIHGQRIKFFSMEKYAYLHILTYLAKRIQASRQLPHLA
jgi:hypothetical protein